MPGNKFLPVILHVCKIWPSKFREDYKLQISDNRVQWETFRRKRDEVMRQWRKSDNKEIRDFLLLDKCYWGG